MIRLEYNEKQWILYALEQACERMDTLVEDIKDDESLPGRVLREEFTRYKKEMSTLHERLEDLFDNRFCAFLSNREFEELSLCSCDDDDEEADE